MTILVSAKSPEAILVPNSAGANIPAVQIVEDLLTRGLTWIKLS